MSDVLLIYSLIMLLLEQALLFFKELVRFKISASVIWEFKITSLSFSEKFKSSNECSFFRIGLLFQIFKKVINGVKFNVMFILLFLSDVI